MLDFYKMELIKIELVSKKNKPRGYNFFLKDGEKDYLIFFPNAEIKFQNWTIQDGMEGTDIFRQLTMEMELTAMADKGTMFELILLKDKVSKAEAEKMLTKLIGYEIQINE